MKKIIIVVCLLIIVVIIGMDLFWKNDDGKVAINLSDEKTSEVSDSVSLVFSDEQGEEREAIEPTRFNLSDVESLTEVLEIKMYMPMTDLEKVLGKPLKVEREYQGAFDADIITYFYNFGTVELEPGVDDKHYISYVTFKAADFEGIRGITVGDSVESVLSKFPNELQGDMVIINGEKFLYGKQDESEYGVVNYDERQMAESVFFFYMKESEYLLNDEVRNSYDPYRLLIRIKDDRVKEVLLGVENVH